jgi:hypothetical protein
MTIQFTPVARDRQISLPPAAVPWIAPARKPEVEEHLFHCLRSIRDGRPQAARPLLVENATLRELYANPHPDLANALRHCLDGFLVELGPDPARWGEFQLSPVILGLALAIHNSLSPPLAPSDESADPSLAFAEALIETLPPARALPEILAYHALLRAPAEALPHLSAGRARLLHALVNLSPLSAVYHLHLHTPSALTPLAAQLLKGWEKRVVSPAPWRGPEDWLNTLVPVVGQALIASYLRRRWLALPETREACRNLGLLLEALRRRGDQRAFILTFYEAYDHFCAETVVDAERRPHRRWPVFDQMERLLRAGGENEAAIRLNRRGNEYFLKFRPLAQIIIDDDHPPTDFNLLSNALIGAVRSAMRFTSDGLGPRLNLESVEFGGGER